jgi:hypothetical protein
VGVPETFHVNFMAPRPPSPDTPPPDNPEFDFFKSVFDECDQVCIADCATRVLDHFVYLAEVARDEFRASLHLALNAGYDLYKSLFNLSLVCFRMGTDLWKRMSS